MCAGFSAMTERAQTNQQLPTPPCRMSSGRGSSRKTTQGTVEACKEMSSRKKAGFIQPEGRMATSISGEAVPQEEQLSVRDAGGVRMSSRTCSGL